MPEPGTVYLVGAGPGDPGLLTLRGAECLRMAGVVIYDYLANPRLLALAKNAAELIYVGKKAGQHTLKQEEINDLLLVKARTGQIIVRLKGGDPFVFGRGGEEALHLKENGVRVEIVPGVTSGVAAPAYAGIPVTHRDCNSVLTFVTGHEDPTKDESAINWHALATGGGTLAFYMGVRNLPGIAHNLVTNGRSPDTPVALIGRGTMPKQRVVTGTLSTIVDIVKAAGLTPPAIILVGDVVSLRPRLQWIEDRPLFGRTIVVTRTRTQASDLASRIEELGGQALLFPTIRIEPPEDTTPLDEAVRNTGSFDWILFTSVNGVDSFFASLARQGLDSRHLHFCRIAAIGSGTEKQLGDNGIKADLMPPRFTSVELLAALRDQGDLAGKRVLLPRADIAPPHLPEGLRESGADVVNVVAYRTVPAEPDELVIDALRNGDVDAVTFTSSSTAHNFADIARRLLGSVPDGVAYLSIGSETTKGVKEEGMHVSAEAGEHTVAGLAETVVDFFSGKES